MFLITTDCNNQWVYYDIIRLQYTKHNTLYSKSINIYVSLQWIIKPFQKSVFFYIYLESKITDNTEEHIEIFEPNVQLEQKSLWDEISFIWLWSKMCFLGFDIVFKKCKHRQADNHL